MLANNSSTPINHARLETTKESSTWDKQDTLWMLSLYGTAIGAGTLFLPINAGLSGIWPLIIMSLLVFPLTYFSHRGLCRFVLSGSKNSDITQVVDEHFGPKAGNIITWLYFFSIYPILLMYSVAITNTTHSFLQNQLAITPPPRMVLALTLILGLMLIVHLGQQFIVKSMSFLVYPFILVLMALAIYLIPYWNGAILQTNTNLVANPEGHGLLMTLWLIIPVMIFSFNHSPIISSFALAQKQKYGKEAEKKCCRVMRYSHLMMVGTVMFFVFSCVLSLSPADLAEAKRQNISILSYLANHFQTPVIAYIAPVIALVAIAKSFLGHYLGAKEGLHGLLVKALKPKQRGISNKTLYLYIELFMILSCAITAMINPSILGMIESLSGPIIAAILFLMPVYATYKIPSMKVYANLWVNCFIFGVGFIALSSILYGLVK